MNPAQAKTFKKTVWDFYQDNRRDLPWRKTKDPYKILVSEMMLQQTQAQRVVPKYLSFLKKFPSTKELHKAPLSHVLKEWQGLGYNRRAMYLKQTAERVEKEFNGKFPKDYEGLISLPGIGPATAGDILAFAWNVPSVLIETNIRSVFIHFFFKNKDKVSDKDILPLIEKTLDMKNPQEWYWALFDYGAYLKSTGNPSRKSVHHIKQSPFLGSNREKRSKVLKLLLVKPHSEQELIKASGLTNETLSKIISDFKKEGLVKVVGRKFVVS